LARLAVDEAWLPDFGLAAGCVHGPRQVISEYGGLEIVVAPETINVDFGFRNLLGG